MRTTSLLVFAALCFFCIPTVHAVTFDFAQIGNAGNSGEISGAGADGFGDPVVGAVPYNFALSKTEVTNAQYVEFLNSVAKSDPYDLYNASMTTDPRGGVTRSGTWGSYTYEVKSDIADYTYANKPVVFVSWYDSIRFTNWLHNGQGAGDTETGAYTLLTDSSAPAIPSNGESIVRNPGAKYWLPNVNEWYKAAYHDASAGTAGTYFEYATGTNDNPDNHLPANDSGNSVNHFDNQYATGDIDHPYTDVGAYSSSPSSYGTYDQNGNVWEWNEPLFRSARIFNGGSADSGSELGSGSDGSSYPATHRQDNIGFRVAALAVPEPSSLLLLLSATGGMLLCKR